MIIFLKSIPDYHSVALTYTQIDTCLVLTATFAQYFAATQYDESPQTKSNTTCKNAVSVYKTEMSSDVWYILY